MKEPIEDFVFPDFLTKPAKSEFFTKFISIYSRTPDGKHVCVGLFTHQDGKSLPTYYCDKVRVDETLEKSIKRSLSRDFGLSLVYYVPLKYRLEYDFNRFGQKLPRVLIYSYVKYSPLKSDKIVGCEAKWINRKDYFLNKNGDDEASELLKKPDVKIFGDKFPLREFINFVDELYSVGAVEVNVFDTEQECYPSDNKDTYINSIKIILPPDRSQRQRVIDIFKQFTSKYFQKDIIVKDQETTLDYLW